MPYAKWGLPTKDTDVFALRSMEGNDVMKVFLIDIIISLSLESDLSLYKIAPRIWNKAKLFYINFKTYL